MPSVELPPLLASPPWMTPFDLPPPTPAVRALEHDLGAVAVPAGSSGPAHAMALAEGRLYSDCAHRWADPTPSSLEAFVAQRADNPSSSQRVCLRVLCILPSDEALAITHRVPPAGFCHESPFLVAAAARLGPQLASFVVRCGAESGRRGTVFKILEDLGTPLAVPLVIDAFVRLASLRTKARRWLRRHAPTALEALVPLAVGASPERLGLAGLCPQDPEALRAGAARGLAMLTHQGFAVVARTVASRLGVEDDFDAVADRHPLAGTRPPKRTPFFDELKRPWTAEGPIDDWTLDKLLGVLALTDWEAADPDVARLREAFTPPSWLGFVDSLMAGWIGVNAARATLWAADVGAQMTDGALTPALERAARAWNMRYQVTSHEVLEVLGRAAIARQGDRAAQRALESLGALALHGSSRAQEAVANGILERVADAMDLPRDTLDDRLIPRLGLDDAGVMPLTAKGWVGKLASTLDPYTVDAEGQKHVDLPRGRAAREAAGIDDAVVERWKALKKGARRVAVAMERRAAAWMTRRQRWRRADFVDNLLGHPVLADLARGLVWGAYAGGAVTPFRVCEDGTFADVDDAALELDDAAEVGLIHPAEVEPDARAAWLQILADYELLPCFDQLTWPVFTLAASERATTELSFLQGRSEPAGPGRLALAGWTSGPYHPRTAWSVTPGYTRFSTATMEKIALHGASGPLRAMLLYAIAPNGGPQQQVVDALVVQRAEDVSWEGRVPFTEMDAVDLSEILRDLNAAYPPT